MVEEGVYLCPDARRAMYDADFYGCEFFGSEVLVGVVSLGIIIEFGNRRHAERRIV